MFNFRRVASCALASAMLASCATIDLPKQNPVTSNATVGYDKAIVYLQQARAALLDKARAHESYDTVTKAGVAVGIAGAGVSSALHDSTKPVVHFLTLGAVSYIANQDVAPAPLA